MFVRLIRAVRWRAKAAFKKANNSLLKVQRLFVRNNNGVNLIGYFSYTFGVAEIGRFFAKYLAESKTDFDIFDTFTPSHKKLDSQALSAYLPHFTLRPRYHKNIYFINADQINVWHSQAKELFLGRYNAAVFFWEFDDYFNFPDAFTVLDEVIAFTDFIATAVRKAAPAGFKVTKFPLPFSQNWTISHSPDEIRQRYAIGKDEFVFIFNFDFLSVYQRKNPEAILQAFEKAFQPDDKVRLILKTIHSEHTSANHESFKKAAEAMQLRSKLLMIDENLDRNEFMSMINASDCYVSLHRSEGLGLGMLEAMSMGKPVIGTNFGGNTDFMNTGNSLPVPFKLVPVTADAAPYKAGWLWAEPDVEQAAASMKQLYLDREFCAGIASRGKASVESQYSLQNFQKFLNNWIQNQSEQAGPRLKIDR